MLHSHPFIIIQQNPLYAIDQTGESGQEKINLCSNKWDKWFSRKSFWDNIVKDKSMLYWIDSFLRKCNLMSSPYVGWLDGREVTLPSTSIGSPAIIQKTTALYRKGDWEGKGWGRS